MGKLLSLLILLLFVLSAFNLSFAQEGEEKRWEFELTGQYVLENHKTMGRANFSAGRSLNDRIAFRAELTAGAVMLKDCERALTGGSFYLRYFPYAKGKVKLFWDLGVGIGYSDEIPGKVRRGVCGLIDTGLGITFPSGYRDVEFVFGYKVSHVSSLRPYDVGLNMQGVVLGLRF